MEVRAGMRSEWASQMGHEWDHIEKRKKTDAGEVATQVGVRAALRTFRVPLVGGPGNSSAREVAAPSLRPTGRNSPKSQPAGCRLPVPVLVP
eukprot:5778905-Pleurochrysis_carterae.AAC.1